MFCEQCGLQLYARESICSRCGVTATRHWLQAVSLGTLTIAIGCNTLVALYLLPRLVEAQDTSSVFRAWLWLNEKVSLYGWVPVTVSLLVWAFWPRHGYEPEKEVQLARILLIAVLLGGIASLLLPLVPSQALAGVHTTLEENPGLAASLAWAAIVLAVGMVCLNAETRDSLLGDGKILSLAALGFLFLVLVLILVGWSAGRT